MGPGEPGGGAPGSIPDGRLMHTLTIFTHVLHHMGDDCGSNEPDQRFVDSLMRQERAASLRIVAGRSHLGEATTDVARDLMAAGLLETETAPNGTELYQLTAAGLEQAQTWRAARQEVEAAFLSPLGDEDKRQLHDLLMKLMAPSFKRMHERQEEHNG